MPLYNYTLTLKDYSKETSTVSFSINAADEAAAFTAGDAITVAIQGMTLGATVRKTVSRAVNSPFAVATSPTAQREVKCLISYADATTGERYTKELPVFDIGPTTLLPNSDIVDASAGTEMATFVTAFEAAHRSPRGNTVQFIEARVVGRNL